MGNSKLRNGDKVVYDFVGAMVIMVHENNWFTIITSDGKVKTVKGKELEADK